MRRSFPSFCGRASRSRAILTRKNSPLPPSLARQVALVRKTCTASFRGNAWQKCDFAALDIKQKSKRKRAGAAQAASAFSFFACLRGKPDPLRCCFPLFPRRIARERAMLSRGNSPLSACAALRARQPPCSKCAHRKVRFSVAGIKLYLGAASRCHISRFCQRKNISLLRGKDGLPIANIYPHKNFTSVVRANNFA